MRVLVRPDGRPQNTLLISEDPPDEGFGQAAERCAMQFLYIPKTNDQGEAITGMTPPFSVRFVR